MFVRFNDFGGSRLNSSYSAVPSYEGINQAVDGINFVENAKRLMELVSEMVL